MSSRGETNLGAQQCREQLAQMFASRPGAATEERLTSVIFDDIVPRLQILHHELSTKDAERAFSVDDVTEFGRILVLDDGPAAERFLETMRARGHSEDSLFLGLMAETARHLGALWEDDRCSFVDVTIGVARLQKMLCVFNGQSEPAVNDERQRAALCALNGERHVFGIDMVACFMRHACWEVELRKDIGPDGVVELIASEWFAVLGFTLSAERELEPLCRAIQAGRAASDNPEIGILVGGPLFRAKPDLVAQVGADAMASDAASASLLAKKLLLRQQSKGAPDSARDARDAALASAQSYIHSSKARNVETAPAMAAHSSCGSRMASNLANNSFHPGREAPSFEKNR
jgi:methanogenic corrinoid protein MtbC1